MNSRERFFYRYRFVPFIGAVLVILMNSSGAFRPLGDTLAYWLGWALDAFLIASVVLFVRSMSPRPRPSVSRDAVKLQRNSMLIDKGPYVVFGMLVLFFVLMAPFVAFLATAPPWWQKWPTALAMFMVGPGGIAFVALFLPRFQQGWQYARGAKLVAAGHNAEGEARMRENLRKNPRKQLAWIGMAYAFLNSWRLLDCLAYAQRALEMKADYMAYTFRAHALHRLGLYDESLRDFAAADRLRHSFDTNNTIGKIWLERGNVSRAIDYLEGVGSGGNIIGKFYLAEAYRAGGYTELARNAYTDIVATNGMAGVAGRGLEACSRARLGHVSITITPAADDALRANPRSVIAIQGLLFANRNDPDHAFHDAQTLAYVSANSALIELSQPEYSHRITEPRFTELVAACTRVREQNIALARRIIGVAP